MTATLPLAAYLHAESCRNLFCRFADEAAIMKVVRSHAARQLGPRRGLIVDFPRLPSEECRGNHEGFVMTAEPKYKKRFVDLLQSEYEGDRCRAIYNLASYPGEETERLLRPMLDDPAQSTTFLYSGSTKKAVTYFSVRQAAYEALTVLGADANPPEPYYPDLGSWLHDTGFENEVYFPPRQQWSASWNPSHFFGAWLAPHILLAILPPLMVLMHKRRWKLTIRDVALSIAAISVLLAMCARALAIMAAGDNVLGDLNCWFTDSSHTLLPVFVISASVAAGICVFIHVRGRHCR